MTNTPDNDRHERALKKAHTAYWDYSSDPEGERDMAKAIAAYLSEMDAMIVPREPTDAMVEVARNEHEGEAYLPYSLYRAMLSAAPHHFNQEGK